MGLNDSVQRLIDAGDWLGLGAYYWAVLDAVPFAHVLIIAAPVTIVGVFLLALLLPGGDPQAKALPPVSTRGYRPAGAVFIPFGLDNVMIDLQPTLTETLHVLIGGATRTGKTTSVLPLFDLPLGVLCIALDITVPIEAKVRAVDGVVWTNDPAECRIGLDILGGSARIASEGLVAGFPKSQGNVGDYQRSARSVIWSALEQMDAAGIERNLPGVILALLQPMADQETARACRSWARKLGDLYRIIGPTLGTDLDVVEAMRNGQKVLLKLNHFLSPDDAPFLAGMLLVLGRRVMQDAGVPFILIVEEAGQAAIAQGHLAPIAQAGAARGVPFVGITQNMSTLPLEVRNNLAVTVSFAQEDPIEQRAAAARLELEPEQVRRSAFPDKGVGWCYIRAPGLPTTLVHVKQQRPSKPAPSIVVVGPSVGPPKRAAEGVWQIVDRPRVDGWQPWMLALPNGVVDVAAVETIPEWVGHDRDWLRIWGGLKRTGAPCPLWLPERGVWWDERGCLEQQKGFNSDGRPRCSIKRKDGLTYRETYRARFGEYPEPTYDHWCDNVKCCDPDHGGPCGIGENNARREPRRTAFALAWATRCDGDLRPTRGVGAAAD